MEKMKGKRIKKEKNGTYTKCIQDGYTGKDRLELGKVSIGKVSQGNNDHDDDLFDFIQNNFGKMIMKLSRLLDEKF